MVLSDCMKLGSELDLCVNKSVPQTKVLIYCLSLDLALPYPQVILKSPSIPYSLPPSLFLWLTAGVCVLPAVCLYKISGRVAYLILKCPFLLLNDYEDRR